MTWHERLRHWRRLRRLRSACSPWSVIDTDRQAQAVLHVVVRARRV